LLCFFVPCMFNNPLLYAVIMMLWLVVFPGFLIISGVSGIVNVMYRVIPAAPCLLISGSLGAVIIAQWEEWSPNYKMWNHTISIHTGRYWHPNCCNEGYIFLTCWSNRNFCSLNSILKELYWISEAPLDVLKVELWFTIGDLNFPTSNGSPCTRQWCCMYQFKWPLCNKKCSVGFSMMLQSHRW
jgi:hypothetical protein